MTRAYTPPILVTRSDYAYRGYMIRYNCLSGHYWIEKDGSFICYAVDRTAAIRIIDTELT